MKNGPAVDAILLNQSMRLRSEPLAGETRFRQLGVGLSGGYYFHIGKHFYIYPTAAFTRNTVPSGSTSIHGTNYTVEKYSFNESVHIGWEWGFQRDRLARPAALIRGIRRHVNVVDRNDQSGVCGVRSQ